MSAPGGIGQITISVHTPSSAAAGYMGDAIALPDLIAVLDAVQRAIYTAAAHERRLPGIRNLSDDVRRQHTLAVVGLLSGGVAIELAPLSVVRRETAPTLFSADEMARITRESAQPVVAGAAQAVKALAACFDAQTLSEPGSLADQIRRYALTLATVALRSGQTIRVRVADDSYTVELEADEESSFQALALAAVERGEIQRYPRCVVRETLGDESALFVEVPYYGHELMRCTYHGGPEHDYAQKLNVGDEVTIFGSLRQVGGQEDVIEVAAILDSWGRIVGRPILDQLVNDTTDNLLAT